MLRDESFPNLSQQRRLAVVLRWAGGSAGGRPRGAGPGGWQAGEQGGSVAVPKVGEPLLLLPRPRLLLIRQEPLSGALPQKDRNPIATVEVLGSPVLIF